MKLEWNPPKYQSRAANLVSQPDYSIHVVFGAERVDGSEMPARDFFSAAIAESDLLKTFADNFDGNSDRAFDKTVEELHDKIKEVIQDDRWSWDRETKRSNGETVGSPRDIVDEEGLLKGQAIEWM